MDKVKQERPKLINWPNSITFFRYFIIIFAWNLKRDYRFIVHSIVIYTISCLMDILDGYVSRKFKQRTVIGALLDQIIDRATTLTSCIDVIIVFPEYKVPIYLWLVVDIFGHWIYFYSSCYVGTIDHKIVNVDYVFVTWYYKYRVLMFITIVCTETFWISAYWYRVMPTDLNYIAFYLMKIVAPFALFRSVVCVYQIFYGLRAAIVHENKLYDKSK